MTATAESDKAQSEIEGRESLFRVTLMGLATQQLVPGIALAGGYLLLYSGNASWLTMLAAGLGALCIMVAVNVFASRYVETGSLMSFAEITFGSQGRRATGAFYVPGLVVATAAVGTSVVLFSSSFLYSLGWEWAVSGWAQAIQGIVFAALAGAVAYKGLDVSINTTAVLSLVGLPIVLWVTFAGVAKTGLSLTDQLSLSGWSTDAFIAGVVVSLAYFVGIDGLAALAAETKNPRRNVPLLLTLVIVVTVIAYVAVILLQVPALSDHADDIGAGESPPAILAAVGGVSFLAKPLDLLMCAATFASLIALMNFAPRILARAGSDGMLPESLGRHEVRTGVPRQAVIVLAVLAAAIPVVLQVVASAPPLESSTYLFTLFSYFWVAPYAIVGVAALLYLYRSSALRPVKATLIVLGIAAFGGLLVYNIVHSAGGVLGVLPWIMLGLAALSYLVFWVHERALARKVAV